MNTTRAVQEFKKNRSILISVLMVLWAVLSFVIGTGMVNLLNSYILWGLPLGFWFAVQGSVLCFVVLLFVYCKLMDVLETKYGIHE